MAQQMQAKASTVACLIRIHVCVTVAQIRRSSCTYQYVQLLVQHSSNRPKHRPLIKHVVSMFSIGPLGKRVACFVIAVGLLRRWIVV